MILFLHGEDAFRVNERRVALQKAFLKKYAQAEMFVFDFEDQRISEDVSRALSACGSGLFSKRKMVVFLHPFVLEGANEKKLLEFLESSTKTATDTVFLFASPVKTKKTHPLARALKAYVDREEVFEKPDTRGVAQYVRRELARIDKEAKFGHGALEFFLSSVGVDTARIRMELEKLGAFKPGGTFTVEDIQSLVGEGRESVVFEALDALGRGERARSVVLFHQEASRSEGAHPLLSMCAWQMRRLLQVREALESGVQRTAEIAARTKLPPFAVQKTLMVARHLPISRIKRGFAMLSDFDVQIKRGALDPAVALDLFVWKF